MNRDLLYTELMLRHKSLIKRIIRQYFPNTMDADDVFQEISIQVLKNLERISLEELKKWESSAWITTVCKNKCKDILKVTKTRNRYFTNTDSLLLGSFNIGNDDHKIEEWKTTVKDLLIGLKKEERKLIILRFIKGYSSKEVGEIMGLINPSVYISRVLGKLRSKINSSKFFEYFDGWVLEDIDRFSDDD
jgi:RNA polymerase sigma-70 factor (ECF subfamily)